MTGSSSTRQMGRPSLLSEIQAHAIGLLIGTTGISNARAAELVFPTLKGVRPLSLYKWIDKNHPEQGTAKAPHKPTTPRHTEEDPPDKPGTFAVHAERVRLGRRRVVAILVIMELHTHWLWVKVMRGESVPEEEIVKGLFKAIDGATIGGAKLSLEGISLLCYSSRVKDPEKQEEAKDDDQTATWYPTVNRKADKKLVGAIREKLKKLLPPRHNDVDFTARLLLEKYWPDEPMKLPGTWAGTKELNLAIQEFVQKFNNAPRRTFARTSEPVTPKERLHDALRQHQLASKLHPLPERKAVDAIKRKNPAPTRERDYMTKADLVEKVQDATGHTAKDSAVLVESVFELMKSTLEGGENLKLSGFGSFELKEKKPRRGRNPQTGEAIEIAPRQVLTFRPSALLKKAVNQED